mgnify:CR=1 FL=1
MKKITILISFFILNNLYAQNNAIRILKPKEIKFATQFNLRFELLNYNGETIKLSTENLKNSDFSYLGINQKGNILEISLIPFNVGVSTFPSIDIYLDSQKITTTPFPLEISPLFNPKENEKLKDIIDIFSFLKWLKFILALIIAIIIYLLYKKIKKKKTKQDLSFIIDTRTPYEIAIDELQKLEITIDAKEFYSNLSEIIRRYIEKEFITNATKMTTLDIIKNIKNQFTMEIAIKIRELLENSDLAKFAKYQFDNTEKQQDKEKAIDTINQLNSIKEEKKRKEEEIIKEKDKQK